MARLSATAAFPECKMCTVAGRAGFGLIGQVGLGRAERQKAMVLAQRYELRSVPVSAPAEGGAAGRNRAAVGSAVTAITKRWPNPGQQYWFRAARSTDVPVTKRGQIGKRETGLRHASIVRSSAPCKPISATCMRLCASLAKTLLIELSRTSVLPSGSVSLSGAVSPYPR
jgi:hypothetical protein